MSRDTCALSSYSRAGFSFGSSHAKVIQRAGNSLATLLEDVGVDHEPDNPFDVGSFGVDGVTVESEEALHFAEQLGP